MKSHSSNSNSGHRMPTKKRGSTNNMARAAMLTMVTALCLLATTPSTVAAFGNSNHKKVLLRDVQTLTLHQGRMTTGRRESPVPQVKCVGGNACGDFEPEVVQCTNAGFDGEDVQWKCQADLPDNMRFGQLDVFCEGFAHRDDPFILKGSCGLEYKLQYTNIRDKYRGGSEYSFKNPTFNEWSRRAKRQSWIELIYFGTWISVAGLILYSFLKNCFQHYREDARNDDPPPPYRASGGHGGGGGGNGGGGGGGGGNNWGSGWNNYNQYKPSSSSTAETGGFRPGFWSGVGLGGVGGYMAANRNNQAQQPQQQQQTYCPPPSSSSSSWGSSSFGGSGMGGGGSSSSAGSSSRPTRTATGFGGTRRR